MDPNWGLDLGFPDASAAIGYLGFPVFLHRVNQELTIAGLLKYPYTLVAMSVDEGKELDRRKGMGFGTTFLGHLGESLANAIRSQPTEIRSEVDVVARYEDLFLFSFPNTDFNDATVPMRRIIDIVRREAMRAAADTEFHIAIACGVLTWEPASGPIDAADFVYRTIEALYQAKKDGANKLQHFRMGFKDEDPDRLRIKHNQTSPLRLKTRPLVSGLLPAAQESPPAEAEKPQRGEPAKKKVSKKAKQAREAKQAKAAKEGKKKKKSPFWKLW